MSLYEQSIGGTDVRTQTIVRPLFIWAALRLPLLAVALYVFRYAILSFIERTIDIILITEYIIALVSTAFARLSILAVLAGVLFIIWVLLKRFFGPLTTYFIILMIASGLLLGLFIWFDTSKLFALLTILILATNLLPNQIIQRLFRGGRGWQWFMTIAVGVAEVFFFRQYLYWLQSLIKGGAKPNQASENALQFLPGILLASAFVAAMLDFTPLIPVEQALRMPAVASIIDADDYNWIEIDETGQYLFATGHGLDHLYRYDLDDMAAPPLMSDAETNGAQGFAYDPVEDEIYVYNTATQALMGFDAATLALKHTTLLDEVSPGDPWIGINGQTDTITVVSEADGQIGVPFLVLNRSTDEILERLDLDAGNILMHPEKPIIYLSFFRNKSSLIAYDLANLEVMREVTVDQRVDRMAYLQTANELLLASPMESRILRYDADTIDLKGSIPSIFGVRVLALDSTHNLLICGSLATGTIAIFDLTNNVLLADYYLGPWLRTIAVDPAATTAYISANGALYRLTYGHLIN